MHVDWIGFIPFHAMGDISGSFVFNVQDKFSLIISCVCVVSWVFRWMS